MIIDLRFKAELPKNIKQIYDQIAFNNIDNFNLLFDEINNKNLENLSWWISQISSRNTIASPLFHNLCCIELVKFLSKKDISYTFILGFKSIYHLLQRDYDNNKNINFILHTKKFHIFKLFIIKRINLIKCILIKILQALLCNISSTIYNKQSYSKKIQIIDVAITPNFIDEDRQYKLESMNQDINNFYIVPRLLLFNFLEYFYLYFYLMKKNKKYFFRENNLKITDFFKMYFHVIQNNKFETKNIYFKNHFIGEVIDEEIAQETNSFQKIEALATFFAFKNISKKIYISKSINWYENQLTDKLWNYSLNIHHKNCNTIGYKGTVPSQLLFSQTYVLKSEYNNNMTPKQICVMGEGFIKETKRFCDDINVSVILALRHQYLKSIKPFKYKEGQIKIFLALPAYDSNQRIIDLMKITSQKLKFDIFINYKIHPINNEKKLQITKNFKECVEISKALNQSELIITGMSSLALEAIALGKYVINIQNPDSFNLTTIPNNVSNIFWRNAYDSDDLVNILNEYYQNRFGDNKLRESKKNEIIKRYFNFSNLKETQRIFSNE